MTPNIECRGSLLAKEKRPVVNLPPAVNLLPRRFTILKSLQIIRLWNAD
jgi:hypothetical protein